jgi:hypothetical protein
LIAGGIQRVICGISCRVLGKEHVPTGACIIAAEHQSSFETYRLFKDLEHPIFILKRELTWIPIVGWYMTRAGFVPIDRGAGAGAMRKMLRATEAALKAAPELVDVSTDKVSGGLQLDLSIDRIRAARLGANRGGSAVLPGSFAALQGTSVVPPGTSVVGSGTSVTELGAFVALPGTFVVKQGTSVVLPGASVALSGTSVAAPGTFVVLQGTSNTAQGASGAVAGP